MKDGPAKGSKHEYDGYFADNAKAWNLRTPHHVESGFYDVEKWKAGGTTLSPLETAWLGDVKGKSLLHLQCHFGQDTLSIARLGANVTGVDLSSESVAAARRLARDVAIDARFVEGNVFDVRLEQRFDIVFTSWGVIGWLPRLEPWAQTIAAHLAPGGRFLLFEFHPYVWMSQTGPDLSIRYSYFNRGVISETTKGTYADRGAPIEYVEHGWNHPLSDVFTALLDAGLQITRFEELDHVFQPCFDITEPRPGGGYWFSEAKGMVPMSYAVEARSE